MLMLETDDIGRYGLPGVDVRGIVPRNDCEDSDVA